MIINVKNTRELTLCTGTYMNYFSDDGFYDIYAIINEANGTASDIIDQDLLNEADEICTEFINNHKDMTKDDCRTLEVELSNLFDYGVQVFRR